MPKAAPEGSDKVTIEVLAHVHAGLAEQHPLDALLDLEGVSAAAFKHAEIGLRQRIAADAMLRADYEEALVAAEDRFARSVAPLDDELAAWLALLDGYAAAPAPFAYLTRLGLRLSDVGRLRRAWARRAEADPDLDSRIATLRKGKLPKLGALRIGATPLVSSKGATSRPAPKGDAAQAGGAPIEFGDIDGLGLDRLAALGAEMQREPGDAEAVRARFGLDRAQHEAILQGLERAFAADASLERDYQRLLAHHAHRLASAAKAGEARRSASVAPRAEPVPAAIDATPPAVSAPVASPPVASPPDASPPAASPPAASPPDAAELARQLGARLKNQGLSLRGTALAPDNEPRAPVMPFVAASEPPAAAIPSPQPAEKRKESVRSGTSLAVDVPRTTLPFAQPPSPSPSPPVRAAAGDPPLALTVEQHASLCVELTGAPSRRAELLARYRISEAEKAAMDAALEQRFAGDAAARGEWQRAYDTYRAWYLGQRGEQ